MLENIPSPAPLRFFALEDLLGMDLPRLGKVLDPWLPERGLGLLHGPRGIGKTHLALAIGHAVATGGRLLRWRAPCARRVVMLDGEMPASVLRERCAALAPVPEAGFLRFLSMDLQDRPLNLANFDDQDRLEPHLERAELIIVDNISTLMRHGVENSAESWGPVQDWALGQRRAGRAVLFVHHSARSGAQRGTSRREDVMDTVLALRPPAEAHATAGARFEVHVEKNRGFWAEAMVPFGAMLRDGGWHMEALSDPHTPLVVALTEEGWSIRQIAERLELSKSTVHRMQYAARLRGLLKGHYYGGLADDRPIPGAAVPAAPAPESRIRGQDDDREQAC